MKRLLFFLLLIPAFSFSQLKISEMPTYSGNPAGAYVPAVIANTNRKIDAAYFGYNKVDSASVSQGSVYDTLYFWKFGIKSFYVLTRASGGTTSSAWGSLTGSISSQTDLSGILAGKASTVHAHTTADVTSGIFSTGRLGTGTANSTTYLRGDGTWATPPGGGSGTLYSTTGSNTDGAITQAATTTLLSGKAASSHVHSGSDINTGYVAPARLGTGMPSAGTVLRGDGTWGTDTATIPVGPTLDFSTGLLNVSSSAGTALYRSVSIATAAYTVPAGILTVFSNYTGGTATITLPSASANLDTRITIQNRSSNNVSVTPVLTGFQNLLVQYNSITYQSDGFTWSIVSK